MNDRSLNSIVDPRPDETVDFESLMSWRVRSVLLVSSLYDSFTFQEDGKLTERLFSEYLELNLRYAPSVQRASNASDALELLRNQSFDLVISMLKVGETDIDQFCRAVRNLDQEIPLVLLANNARELAATTLSKELTGTDRVFVWRGDVRLFLAIIKSVEDRINAWNDSRNVGVPVIILVEDNVRFYSSYLPLLYTELMEHSQALMSDGLNRMQKIFRMRSRPKILLATNYEEGMSLYEKYREHVIGIIVDASFPRGDEIDDGAGISFAREVTTRTPDRPILMQSSNADNAALIEELGGTFIQKQSPTLLNEVRRFLRDHLGFAEFQFKMPNGKLLGMATDLRSLQEMIARVPVESIMHHGGRNDFSTWLMNRAEFAMARELRPKKVADFESPEELREHLLRLLEQHRDSARAGVVAEFSSGTFEGKSGFVRIGSGSLGGKGRGLAFMHSLLDQYEINERFEDVNIFVPPTAVVAVGTFDRFMSQNNLTSRALAETSDERVANMFMEQSLPADTLEALRTFLARVHYPLAVRSSSLLEDGSHMPFAGVYDTCMIPNNHTDPEVRLKHLSDAIKRVYASTYFNAPKAYIEATPHRLEEEKMAVVIQQLVGRTHGDYLYPMVAGVARSYNFYPIGDIQQEDGIASMVLGLGKMVVDGGRSVRYSPKHPRKLYQFSSIQDTLRSAQSDFFALDLRSSAAPLERCEDNEETLAKLGLDVAEADGMLNWTGSVYDQDSDAIYDGISRKGPRLVTMAGLLKSDVFPIAQVLGYLLQVGSAAFSCPVEMEFAADFRATSDQKHQFGFLQIRPLVTSSGTTNYDLDTVDRNSTICVSHSALGHGYSTEVRDLVYVPKKTFDRARTVDIAGQIGVMNGKLQLEKKAYALIGPGRWGSADRWLGIPVSWSQISHAACIVETDMPDIRVTPSQGTHFFQNMTSLGISYFTVNFEGSDDELDMDWLDSMPAHDETEFVRHLRFDVPLEIAVNGRNNTGVIMKPGEEIFRASPDGER